MRAVICTQRTEVSPQNTTGTPDFGVFLRYLTLGADWVVFEEYEGGKMREVVWSSLIS